MLKYRLQAELIPNRGLKVLTTKKLTLTYVKTGENPTLPEPGMPVGEAHSARPGDPRCPHRPWELDSRLSRAEFTGLGSCFAREVLPVCELSPSRIRA